MDLTVAERDAMRLIIEHVPTIGRLALLKDLALAEISAINADRSLIEFSIPGYERPAYQGQHPVPVEGVLQDADGALVHALVHVDPNERLFEFELVRFGDGPLIAPDWRSMQLR